MYILLYDIVFVEICGPSWCRRVQLNATFDPGWKLHRPSVVGMQVSQLKK